MNKIIRGLQVSSSMIFEHQFPKIQDLTKDLYLWNQHLRSSVSMS